MGCWNETCAISKLPILHGDKVRLFIIYETGYDGRTSAGFSSINDIWAPLSYPIQGEYDDYGCIENIIENEKTEYLFKYLINKCAIKTSKFDDEIENFSDALKAIERGRVALKNTFGENVRVGHMMVLEEIYQKMINYNPIITSHRHDINTFIYVSQKEHFKKLFENYFEKFEFFKKITKNILKSSSPTKINEIEGSILTLTSSESPFFYSVKPNLISELLQDKINKSESWDESSLQSLIQDSIDALIFDTSLSEVRMSYAPQSGKGSQNSETKLHKILNLASNDIIQNRIDNEDNSYDEDENGYCQYMLEHNERVSK